MIELTNICKTFRVARRGSGMKSASKALFHREYEKIEALRNVSFTIQDGEMVGYIGPNGAGKSSSIKIMSGILTPDSGTCRINGKTPWKQRKEHVRNIGVVFGQRSQLWWDVPVIDSFELIRDIYSVEPTRYRKNLDMLTTMLSLETILKTPTRQLSLGQRMRRIERYFRIVCKKGTSLNAEFPIKADHQFFRARLGNRKIGNVQMGGEPCNRI